MSFPRSVSRASSKVVSALVVCLALLEVAACEPSGNESVSRAATATPPRAVDILFMVDNSSSMTSMQQKMLQQIPLFINGLQALPGGLPDLHLAVVSSDMGAPSDQGQQGISCSQFGGDNGQFFAQPQGTCIATTLSPGATFITDNASGTSKNFTAADPAGLATVLQCIALLGSNGCGFEHQLASVARALGADGQPPPVANAGFLRPDAELAIVLLTNEDDCSAPASASPLPIYSLNGAVTNDLTTPDGPIANYRCNGGPLGGHLCDDPTGPLPTTLQQPPLNPPADATGNPPTLALANCESNDTGSSGLTPVGAMIAGIKALKSRPDSEIVVGAVMAPATPYVVEWLPGPGAVSNQEWPQVEHSCFVADGSFGDPPVRIAQFVQAFGDNGVTGSICDGTYAPAFELIASKIAAHLPAGGSGSGGHDGGSGSGSAGATGDGSAGTMGSGGTHGTGVGGTPGTGSAGTTGTGGTASTGSAGTSGAGAGGTPGTGNGGTPGTGAGGTPGTGSGGTPGTGDGGTPGTGSGGAPGGVGGHAGASPRDGGEVDGAETLGMGGGCGCETGGGSASTWSLTLLVGMIFVRRTRRRV